MRVAASCAHAPLGARRAAGRARWPAAGNKPHRPSRPPPRAQALYEAVRADRNLYSKGLIEAQDEISELRRKAKVAGHVAEQLKEEIGAKDLALVKEHFDHMKARTAACRRAGVCCSVGVCIGGRRGGRRRADGAACGGGAALRVSR